MTEINNFLFRVANGSHVISIHFHRLPARLLFHIYTIENDEIFGCFSIFRCLPIKPPWVTLVNSELYLKMARK